MGTAYGNARDNVLNETRSKRVFEIYRCLAKYRNKPDTKNAVAVSTSPQMRPDSAKRPILNRGTKIKREPPWYNSRVAYSCTMVNYKSVMVAWKSDRDPATRVSAFSSTYTYTEMRFRTDHFRIAVAAMTWKFVVAEIVGISIPARVVPQRRCTYETRDLGFATSSRMRGYSTLRSQAPFPPASPPPSPLPVSNVGCADRTCDIRAWKSRISLDDENEGRNVRDKTTTVVSEKKGCAGHTKSRTAGKDIALRERISLLPDFFSLMYLPCAASFLQNGNKKRQIKVWRVSIHIRNKMKRGDRYNDTLTTYSLAIYKYYYFRLFAGQCKMSKMQNNCSGMKREMISRIFMPIFRTCLETIGRG